MTPALVVAEAAIREHVRRKLVAFFAIGSVVLTLILIYFVKDRSGEIFIGAGRANIAATASLGVLQLFALLAALATSMGNIGRAFSSGEAILLLARPVARWEYALGRFLGSAGLIAALCLLLAVETQVVQIVADGRMSTFLWGHWAVSAFNLIVIAAICTLFSVFIPTPIIVAILAYVVNQAVGAAALFHSLARRGVIRGTFAKAVEVAWYATPKFLTSPIQIQQMRGQATVDGSPIQPSDFLVQNSAGLVVWAVAYLVGLMALAMFLTHRKEI